MLGLLSRHGTSFRRSRHPGRDASGAMSERLQLAVQKTLAGFTLDVAWTAGDGVAVLFGSSIKIRFLKILPAHFIWGGYLASRTLRIARAVFASSSGSPC